MKKMSLLAIAALAAAAIAAPFKVIGYFPYWAQYSQFMPKDVRYQFVTHIHYASLAPEDGSIALADENDAPQFQELAKNAAENKVSLIASIGGFEVEGNLKAIAEDDSKLSTFCDAAAEWVEKYNLGGVELDWQNATGEDAAAIGKLVGALKSKLSSKEVAVLTYASSMDAYSDALNQADYVVLMLGDQMSDSESSVKPNLSKQDVAGAVNSLAGKGVSKDKIVPVVSLYGKSFAGASGLGSSHQGVGSGNEGFIPYKELMKKFEAPDYKVSFDEASASEVAVSDAETIVFTGIPSMKALCGLVKDEGLAGVAAYDLSQDHNESIVSLMVTIGLQLRPGVDYSGKKRK